MENIIASEPQLAPPGAGLPKPELFIARFIFAWKLRTGNRETFNRTFQNERILVSRLVQQCDDASAAKRVLIERARGMEDSSRNWSVWMTLEHLRIIHDFVSRNIDSLARGVVPPDKASTATVKPRADVTAAVVGQYEKSCDRLLETVAAIPDLNTSARYEHPWFGPLNAAGWHAMAGTHLAIHRVQLERIVAGLAK